MKQPTSATIFIHPQLWSSKHAHVRNSLLNDTRYSTSISHSCYIQLTPKQAVVAFSNIIPFGGDAA